MKSHPSSSPAVLCSVGGQACATKEHMAPTLVQFCPPSLRLVFHVEMCLSLLPRIPGESVFSRARRLIGLLALFPRVHGMAGGRRPCICPPMFCFSLCGCCPARRGGAATALSAEPCAASPRAACPNHLRRVATSKMSARDLEMTKRPGERRVCSSRSGVAGSRIAVMRGGLCVRQAGSVCVCPGAAHGTGVAWQRVNMVHDGILCRRAFLDEPQVGRGRGVCLRCCESVSILEAAAPAALSLLTRAVGPPLNQRQPT